MVPGPAVPEPEVFLAATIPPLRELLESAAAPSPLPEKASFPSLYVTMKAPGTPEPMQPATSTSAPRKLPEMMVPPADTWPLGQRRTGVLAGLLTVSRNNPASYPMLACKVPLKAPAPLEAEKVKNMATASEPDPADPEPDTFSWALLEFWAFRPYAVPIGPSPEPARSPTNTKRQSILRLLGEVIIKQRVAFDRPA